MPDHYDDSVDYLTAPQGVCMSGQMHLVQKHVNITYTRQKTDAMWRV